MMIRPLLALPVVVLLAACSVGGAPSASPAIAAQPTATPEPSPSAPPAVELSIFGAASLRPVLDAVRPAYEAAHPGVTLIIATDSSAALATQIEQGAPADVFLSADTTNAQRLVDGGFAAGAAAVFAANALAVIVPAGNPAGLTTPADLARPGVKVIAAGDEVPITKYAAQLVANLARLPGYPPGFEVAYAANVVSREDNVRAVAAKVELGEGDAGIVYVTDAAASARVATLPVPDDGNVLAAYAGVVVAASDHVEAARAFLDWMIGSDGQAILASFGFRPPAP
jgi:molybdate transport system substrate-binding protein